MPLTLGKAAIGRPGPPDSLLEGATEVGALMSTAALRTLTGPSTLRRKVGYIDTILILHPNPSPSPNPNWNQTGAQSESKPKLKLKLKPKPKAESETKPKPKPKSQHLGSRNKAERLGVQG